MVRLFYLLCLVFLEILLLGSQSYSQDQSSKSAISPQAEFARTFRSSVFQFPVPDSPFAKVPPGRYPQAVSWFLNEIIGQEFTEMWGSKDPSCQWDNYKKDYEKSMPKIQATIVSNYVRDCRDRFETGIHSRALHSLFMLSQKLSIQENPFLQRVVINLPTGKKLKARLALKGDMRKRPLIILRLGVFASSEEFRPERYLYTLLFEQSPFNMLVIENTTSADYNANNKVPLFGGLEEGLQNVWIAQVLKDPREPLSQLVSSIHVVGVSLGGHGVLAASLFNKLNLNSISSFLAFCPVVHLKPTTDFLQSNNIYGMVIDFWSRQRLKTLKDRYPEFFNWQVLDWISFKPHFLNRVFSEVENQFDPNYYRRYQLKIPDRILKATNFWQANDFWPEYQDISSPVLVFATKMDHLVPFEINSGKLNESNIGVYAFEQGSHCTLPVGYRWPELTGIIYDSFTQHIQNFRLDTETSELGLDKKLLNKGEPNWEIQKIEWDQVNQKREVTLVLKNGENHIYSVLPLERTDFRFRNETISNAERVMLTRWIRRNVKVIQTASGLKLQWSRLN